MKKYWKNLGPVCLLIGLQVLGTENVTAQVSNERDNSQQNPQTQIQRAEDSVRLQTEGRAFIMKAATAGSMEVDAANLALKKSKNQTVKDFAARMLRDHTNANQELKALAQSKGIQLPKPLADGSTKHMSQMNNMKESQFDEHYIRMMVDDHKKAVDLFTDASNLSDPELKAFARKTLPVIKEHYNDVLEISKQLNTKTPPNRNEKPDLTPARDEKSR